MEEYKVVEVYPRDMERTLNELIKEGWRLKHQSDFEVWEYPQPDSEHPWTQYRRGDPQWRVRRIRLVLTR